MSASTADPSSIAATAASMRSRSSYHAAVERGPSPAVDPDDVGRPAARCPRAGRATDGSHADSSRYAATNAASVAGWAATEAKTPGASTEDATDRGGEHRARHRTSPSASQPRRAQQLGQPVDGQERDSHDAVSGVGHSAELAGGEQTPCCDADIVGRHHDGDGEQADRRPSPQRRRHAEPGQPDGRRERAVSVRGTARDRTAGVRHPCAAVAAGRSPGDCEDRAAATMTATDVSRSSLVESITR